MTLPGRFGAVVTAMVTPFDEDGRLDPDGAAQLARWLTANGSDALVVGGSTGESTVLTDQEKVDLWKAVAEAVTVPVIAGSGTADTSHSIVLTRAATDVGADAILAVTPYYSRPPPSGLEAHFEAVAGATSLPVMVYDIPVRTGRRLGTEVVISLVGRVANVVALKDAAGDLPATARLAATLGDRLEVYSGDSSLTLPMLAVGASGVVGVASHWSGSEQSEMVAAFAKGDPQTARQINGRLLESYAFESSDTAPNPMPSKAMLRVLGLPAGQCRLPLGAAPLSLDHEARAVLARLRRDGREARADRSGDRPPGGAPGG